MLLKRNKQRAGTRASDGKKEGVGFRRGATMTGVRNKARTEELERIAARKKSLRRRALIWAGIILVMLFLVVWTIQGVKTLLDERRLAESENVVEDLTPKVQIFDENAGENISDRVKEFVARLEKDLQEYGMTAERVVLPFQMTREVDVYIEGRTEYYKMSIDRGSAVQAEDTFRVQKYLDEKSLTVSYVDIRVEGKAFYK